MKIGKPIAIRVVDDAKPTLYEVAVLADGKLAWGPMAIVATSEKAATMIAGARIPAGIEVAEVLVRPFVE